MKLSKKQQKTLDIARYFAMPLEPTPLNPLGHFYPFFGIPDYPRECI